jgi:hypothetical protein
LGILRALIVMRMKGIRSLRELTRILDVDNRIRKLSLIKRGERGYTRSVISRFTKRVGAERLRKIIEEKIIHLLRRSKVDAVDVVMDPSFVKAWSIRHPDNSRTGFSDSDAKVGRNGKSYDLGYKVHLSIDPERILPLAVLVASANENEKKHAPSLIERTRMVLEKAGVRLRRLIGDCQYSSRKVRGLVGDSVIPYTSNQSGVGVLRVDRWFRTHGPEELRSLYRKRPMVESAFSFLKTQYGLAVNKVRRLANVSVYALLSVFCHILVREAAENMGRLDKVVSPTFFNT